MEHIEDVNFEGPGSQSISKLENTLVPSATNDEPTIMMKTVFSFNVNSVAFNYMFG